MRTTRATTLLPGRPAIRRGFRRVAATLAVAVAVTCLAGLPSGEAQTPSTGTAVEAPRVLRAAGQIAVSNASVRPKERLRVTGRVPAKSYRPVQLQMATNGTWRRVDRSRTTRAGRFIFKVEAPARPGKVRYRVHAPTARSSQGPMRPVTTRAVTVTVIDPLGSRTNPYDLGEAFRIADWTIRVHATDYDTYPDIDHELYDPPEPGWNYISYSATYTYHGDGGSTPDMDMAIDFLAADNRVYDAYSGGNVCGEADPDLDDIDDMYAGASVTANNCTSVPTTLAHDGLWRFGAYLGNREIFVRAN